MAETRPARRNFHSIPPVTSGELPFAEKTTAAILSDIRDEYGAADFQENGEIESDANGHL